MTGTRFVTRPSSTSPRTMKPANTRAPAMPPAMAPARARGFNPGSDLDDLEVARRAPDPAGIEVVEDEARIRVPLPEVGGRLPAHVTEHVAWPRGLNDGDVGAVHESVERSRRLGIARVSENL